ncbi:hypothetical protein [Paracidobacterium acidisoli]|uniref:Uncharacterized protein n=1 Tax=Paracidobacterium acidisoli TaxID=2303751 RepID=A0A372IME5_9BACT|nr:hypothetical protein [Paracidobacterium acidisoli]MBT9332555.1 hypothetical protein [Paracidobacterium acidisoli]
MNPMIQFAFPHVWTAEILSRRPLILPPRHFVYPREAEEVERGALDVMICPAEDEPFLATCALGFTDPSASAGLWSCPDPHQICAVSGGYAYLIDTTNPQHFTHLPLRPVLEVRALTEQNLLLFAGHHTLLAWSTDGEAWQTRRLSWEGLTITGIVGNELHGLGWDLMTDCEIPFIVDLKTGDHSGGVNPASTR